MMRFAGVALLAASAWSVVLGQTPKANPADAPGSYLGVMVQEISPDRAKTLKLTEETGLEITRIDTESPADKAGLKIGDVVQQFNGQRVEGLDQFAKMVRETPHGREAKLNIVRDGMPMTVTAKLGTKHSFGAGVVPLPGDRFDVHLPDLPRSFMSWRSSVLGVEAESLEGQLAQYFGVKEGVLVRSVLQGSPAEKAAIKAGDVIVRVADTKVVTPADVSARLRATRGKPVAIVVMRDHKEVTVNVTLSDEPAR